MRSVRMSYRARPSQRFSLGINLCSGGLLLLMLLALGGAFGNLYRPADDPMVPVPAPQPNTSYPIDKSSVVSDFDGDGQADLATSRLEGSRYKIEIQLSTRQKSVSFTVPSLEPQIKLIAWDLDGDQDYDLIILSASSLEPLGVWLNDGHGNFEKSVSQSHPSPLLGDHQSTYHQNRAQGAGAALCGSSRLSFDRSPSGFISTSLKPGSSIPNESQKSSSNILTYNPKPRSPPLSTLL